MKESFINSNNQISLFEEKNESQIFNGTSFYNQFNEEKKELKSLLEESFNDQFKIDNISEVDDEFDLDIKKEESFIIKNFEKTIYLCPICKTFPKIVPINYDNIIYICMCKKRKNGIKLSIKKDLDEKFLTFPKDKQEEIDKYVKCKNKEIHPNKLYPFVCYCINCKQNLCEDCLVMHKNAGCELDLFVLHNSETRKMVKEIIEIINNENKYIDLSMHCKGSLFGEIKNISNNNFTIQNTSHIKIVENENGYEEIYLDPTDYSNGKNIKNQNLNSLIYIIIRDFFKYPNDIHFTNIENILNYLKNLTHFTLKSQ